MAHNLPLATSQAETLKIKERVAGHVSDLRATVAYIAPDVDPAQRDLEVGMELVRAGHRLLRGSAPEPFHCEGCGCGASGTQNALHGQEDAPESEWASLAKGTLP